MLICIFLIHPIFYINTNIRIQIQIHVRTYVRTSVGPAEVLEKLLVLNVIKNQINLWIKCYVLRLLRDFSHEGIRCYSFSFPRFS